MRLPHAKCGVESADQFEVVSHPIAGVYCLLNRNVDFGYRVSSKRRLIRIGFVILALRCAIAGLERRYRVACRRLSVSIIPVITGTEWRPARVVERILQATRNVVVCGAVWVLYAYPKPDDIPVGKRRLDVLGCQSGRRLGRVVGVPPPVCLPRTKDGCATGTRRGTRA